MIAVPLILLGLLLSLLVLELVWVRRIARRIGLRIHVNGSRGKSSVTRYIAAGLRNGGKKTLGKITGIIPTILLPDGKTEIIQRHSSANVREQRALLRLAAKLGCDALVLECMSIASTLQQIETRMLQPHITVITNILEDHLEELGITDAERTEAYCSALPSNAIIVTTDTEHIWEIEQAASDRKSRVILAQKDGIDLSPYSLSPIAQEHALLSLTVCKVAGVDGHMALEGILREIKSDESLLYTIPVGEQTIRFINGFAVNDVPSAKHFLNTWRERLGNWDSLVFILNTRSDRPRRSVEFAKWCSSLDELTTIILTGTHVPFTKRMLHRYGISEKNIRVWTSHEAQHPKESLCDSLTGTATVVFGFGNIAGDGFLLLDAMKNFQEGTLQK